MGMTAFQFYKFSPCGNITVFLTGACKPAKKSVFCAEALRELGGEQAAWAEPASQTFSMAGGEFCVNASRAFGALLSLLSPEKKNLKVFNARLGAYGEIELEVAGQEPLWQVKAVFKQSILGLERANSDTSIVALDGITHLLREVDSLPKNEDAPALARELWARWPVGEVKARGAIFWRPHPGGMEILPYVEVPGIGSAMIESSCGSASICVAATAGGRDKTRVLQPSGEVLAVEFPEGLKGTICAVEGPVSLVSCGKIWLNGQETPETAFCGVSGS